MTDPKDQPCDRPAKKPPGPRTSDAIQRGRAKFAELPLRPFMGVEASDDGTPVMGPTHSDTAGHSEWLMSILGSTSASFVTQQMRSLEVATGGDTTSGQPNAIGLNSALALIGAVDPQDELEGALATQMAGCHALSMAMLCRAKSTNQADHLQLYGNMAVKLQRTFVAQIEALARLRGKGQQTVRVEHVTVQSGAQAIVGDVHHHARGGRGGNREREDQAHGKNAAAPIAAPSPTLPSPDSRGLGVPIAGDAERTVPTPRRRQHRGPSRKSERP